MPWDLLSVWAPTLSLIFGGCCSNAITLQQLTTDYPNLGTLITFSQFTLVSLYGLSKHLEWTVRGPRLAPRQIPLAPYLIQVVLFYFISLLNNAAFGYRIPMVVHIIFRSGGLIVSMVLGYSVAGKRYNFTQVISVIMVTLGVILTTLSAAQTSSSSSHPSDDAGTYFTGIAILSLALFLSGFLGLVQDWTWARYGRPIPSLDYSPQSRINPKPSQSMSQKGLADPSPAWQESMFYLHFLSLPMFYSLRGTISTELSVILSSPILVLPLRQTPSFGIPVALIPLIFNSATQLICVAGVNRLTTQVSSLTVTLVLVVRKAVSLLISVAFMDAAQINRGLMWTGAFLVLLGTVAYSLGGQRKRKVE